MKSKFILISLFLFLLGYFIQSFAFLDFQSYDLNYFARIQENPVRYAIDDNFFKNITPGHSTAKSIIQNCLSIWGANNSNLTFTETAIAIEGSNKGSTIDFFTDDLNMPLVLAITYPNFEDETISRSDIYFNTEFNWNSNASASFTEYSLDYVALHEIGHAIGFDHPDQADNFNLNFDPDTLIPTNITGDEVMISSVGSGTQTVELSNDEIGGRNYIYGIEDDTPDAVQPPDDSMNIALRSSASASSSFSSTYDPSLVVDGFYKEKQNNVYYWILPNNTLGWIEVDLGSKQDVNFIRWRNTGYKNFNSRATGDYKLFVSADGSSYTKIYEGHRNLDEKPKWATHTINEGKVRYIKLDINSIQSDGAGCVEIEAYISRTNTPDPPTNLTNVAFGKSISAKGSFDNQYGASSIVDGIKNDKGTSGYWLYNKAEGTPKATIQLGQTFNISYIRIKNTGANSNQYATQRFRIFSKVENAAKITQYVGTFAFSNTPSWYGIQFDTPFQADKIILKFDKFFNNAGGISEVEVYTEDV